MYNKLTFVFAREAIKHIVRTYNIKEMQIPYYLCDVVRHTLFEEGCKPVFYHIDDNFYPDCSFDKNDYILYPNYWGVCGGNVQKLVNIYPKLIVDNAHAYYDKPSGFACFNAGHKFGYSKSFLWVQSETETEDYTQFDTRERQKIFHELHKKYKNINTLKIDLNSIPFIYPCLTSTMRDADELAKQLKNEGKTVYRYWNPLPENFLEYKFYSRLVPIPVLPCKAD